MRESTLEHRRHAGKPDVTDARKEIWAWSD
jgi:hypothetical protein